MLTSIGNKLVSAVEAMGAQAQDIVMIVLLALPIAVFVTSLSFAIARRNILKWQTVYCVLSDSFLFLFAAFALLTGMRLFVAVIAFALAGVFRIFSLFFFLIPKEKKKKVKKMSKKTKKILSEISEREEVSESEREATEKPRKICCFPGEESEQESKMEDVRLDYAFSIVDRLRALPLGAGDRLETEKAGELLSVYKNKGGVNTKEAETLNDILASLLKMMAKYGV